MRQREISGQEELQMYSMPPNHELTQWGIQEKDEGSLTQWDLGKTFKASSLANPNFA